MSIPNQPKAREKVIPIRYPTPSRTPIILVVAQRQDAQGRWMVPTIAFKGDLQQHLESGRFALDLGIAFIVSAYWYEQYLLAMKKDYLGEDNE